MAAPLPHPVRLKLEQTLAQWRHWRGEPRLPGRPVFLRALSGGASNFALLVEAGERFVVRIDGIDPAAHRLHRQGEWQTLVAAHAAGLAPQPRYFNPELGSLVCDYLPADTAQPTETADVGRLLRRIHRLPARHHRLDLPERLLSYEKMLAQRGPGLARELAAWAAPVRRLLGLLEPDRHAPVLCHNDLLRANRLYSGGRLRALDWEYSAMGCPWFDLGVVAGGDDLDEAAQARLLEHYLEQPPGDSERRRLRRYACVYRYLELLWYACQADSREQEEAVRRRLAGFADALEGERD